MKKGTIEIETNLGKIDELPEACFAGFPTINEVAIKKLSEAFAIKVVESAYLEMKELEENEIYGNIPAGNDSEAVCEGWAEFINEAAKQ